MSVSDVVQRGGDGDTLVMSEPEPGVGSDSKTGSESGSSCESTTDLECSESGAERVTMHSIAKSVNRPNKHTPWSS